MSSRSTGRRAVLAICTVAALAGGVLAATVTSAQGPGDYEPSTVTVTATGTLASPGPDFVIRLNLKGTAGKQKADKFVKVKAEARVETRSARQAGSIFVSSHGKLALKVEPGDRGARCLGMPKGKDRRFKLGNDFDTISSGEKTTLRLEIPKAARKQIARRAVCKDTKAKAKIRTEARADGAVFRKKDRVVKVRPS